MDISVSRLNGRLASKLPPELPLGLVFVVGQVGQVGGRRFVLKEGTYRLNCRAIDDVTLREGDDIRASGHLMFDSEHLQYYLLARDVEVVTSEPLGTVGQSSRELLAGGEALLTALAAVKARAAAAPERDVVEVPVWVQKLAPPGVDSGENDEQAVHAAPVQVAGEVTLDADLVSMLSAAMDSDEELELTPELLAPYQVAVSETAVPVEKGVHENDVRGDLLMDTAVPTTPTSYQPANRQDTDWLVILLIISFLVLTIAAIVTIVLLIL